MVRIRRALFIRRASATLIEKHERERKKKAGIENTIRGRQAAALDARGTADGTIGLIGFAIIMWKLEPFLNSALVLGLSLVFWFIVSFAIWRLRK
jgi:hypothetical protein